MFHPLILALALTLGPASADTIRIVPADPHSVVLVATRAVQGDSAGSLAAHWEAQLQQDSSARAPTLGLATLARLTYDYPTADRLYQRLFVSDSLEPDRYAAYGRLGLAWALDDRGQSSDAGAEFARARMVARRVRDPAAEGEALIGISFVRARTEGVTVALALLDSAGRLIPDSAFDLQSERLRRRAIVLGIAGRPDAMAQAAASIAAARRVGDLRAEAHGLRAAAKILSWRGQEDSSLTLLRKAEEMFGRAHDRSWRGVTIMDRVQTLIARGDLGEAKEALPIALADGEASHNLFTIAEAHTGFGAVAIQVNDLPTAIEHLTQAATMYDNMGDPSSAIIPRKHLAVAALATGDLATAKEQTLRALAFYLRTQEAPEQFDLQRTLAAIATRQGDWESAELSLAEARDLAHRLRMRHWSESLAYDEGRLALARGNLPRAERSFTRYLSTLDSAQHIWRYDARLRLADVLVQRGRLAPAEREATSAWDELDRWRAGLGDRELRLLAFQASPSEDQVSTIEQSDQYASVPRVLGGLAAGGRVKVAFDLAERRRARELMDWLMRGEALRTGGGGTRPPAPTGYVTADSVVAMIPDDHTALLEYVVGAARAPMTLFVVQRSGIHSRILPPTDLLGERITRFAALVESGDEAETLGRSLGATLLDRGIPDLGPEVKRLVIIPDGPLHRMPWDALRLADGKLALERWAISVAPSAAVVTSLWRRARKGGPLERPVRLLAFGDPALDSEGQGEDSSFRAVLPRVKESGREALLVARYAPEAEVRLRERATAAYLVRAPLQSFRVLHFATHALVDEGSVARTGLVLASGDGKTGFVGPGELGALKLDADLVVLSACSSAGGKVVQGEGVQGLTAPLLQAGARSVVATRWRIGDRSTVTFVQAFYGALAHGRPVGEALRLAKLDAIRRGRPASEWAAFVAVGDPLVTIPLRMPSPLTARRAAALLALALALTAVFVLRMFRRSLRPTGVSKSTAVL